MEEENMKVTFSEMMSDLRVEHLRPKKDKKKNKVGRPKKTKIEKQLDEPACPLTPTIADEIEPGLQIYETKEIILAEEKPFLETEYTQEKDNSNQFDSVSIFFEGFTYGTVVGVSATIIVTGILYKTGILNKIHTYIKNL